VGRRPPVGGTKLGKAGSPYCRSGYRLEAIAGRSFRQPNPAWIKALAEVRPRKTRRDDCWCVHEMGLHDPQHLPLVVEKARVLAPRQIAEQAVRTVGDGGRRPWCIMPLESAS
jgi:hypothetical protein